MAYISNEEIKVIRAELKTLLSVKEGWKVSIIRENHSVVNVTILEAPYELRNDVEKSYEQTNPYYLKERKNEKSREILQKISDIVNKTNFDDSDLQSDYHHVGFYFHLNLGRWDKPFLVSGVKVEETVTA